MLTATALETFENNASRLARFLGVTPQAVYAWGENVPRHWGYELQVRTRGKLKYIPAAGSQIEQLTQRYNGSLVPLDK